MIVGTDFVIATPPKCGTHSYEALSKIVPGMAMIRPQHLMIVPEEHADKLRYICVRDPYDRLVSMWTFICHSSNRTQWGAKIVRGYDFDEWLTFYINGQAEAEERPWQQGRSPWTWTKTLTQCAGSVVLATPGKGARLPTIPLKLEEADDALARLVKRHGLVLPPHRTGKGLYDANNNKKFRQPFRWSKKIIALCNLAGAKGDAEMFGYEVRE